ncbi:MAG: FkbM family methyltransferase [Anaerolineae bacterium]|nr:FkbM family methyltransferase [Anaerolineae bacterium]
MHILKPISTITRNLQRVFPQRPIRGMSRLGNLLTTCLPAYESVVTMNHGFKMRLQSAQGAEMGLLLAGMYQPALTHILAQYSVQSGYYLDIGANLGFFSLLFASWAGDSGKVASFEVNPQMVARVQDGKALNDFDIDIVEKAVHNKAAETISFYVSSSAGKSSIYGEQVSDITQQITVETITIDAYIQQMGWSRVDMIKMDIEGNDCQGLLGGSQTIRQYQPFIVFEYWRDTSQATTQQAKHLLSDVGYQLEILHLNGKRQPFDWHVPNSLHHVDVLCFPPEN